VSARPVDLPGCCFLFFLKIRFAHNRRPAKRWHYGKRVQIPRCRATVSEDIATGHWGTLKTDDLGRPVVVAGCWSKALTERASHSHSQVRRPA
jgi:hypothetical protein